MVGLGCGARSYTGRLHYSTEYAVGARGVLEVLDDYLARSPESFAQADHGVEPSEEDQRRRWVIKSILRAEGFAREDYQVRFGPLARELEALVEAWFVHSVGERLALTERGLERSDAIGPYLYSSQTRALMESCDLR